MIRERIARKLRALATLLDGREMIEARWHQTNVRAMNKYIGRTERYIVALENYIQRQLTCVVCECSLWPDRDNPPHCLDCRPDEDQQIDWEEQYLENPVEDLRKKHGRFDTKPLIEAGAWKN